MTPPATLTKAASGWSTHQLAEFLVAVAACATEDEAIACAVQWAAESMEAEVAAVVVGGEVVTSVGFPRDRVPVAELVNVASFNATNIDTPELGWMPAIAATVEGIDGHLVLSRSGDEPFDAEEVSLLRAIARTLSLTVRNLRIVNLLQERQVFLERLSTIQASISARAPLAGVLDSIVTGARDLLGDEVVAIRLVDPDNPRFMNIMSSVGVSHAMLAETTRSPVSEGVGGRAIVENRLIIATDYANSDISMNEYALAQLQSAMATPVHDGGTAIGSIVVATYRPDREYTETEREMLVAFAHHASIALCNAKAVDEIHHLAYHDPLTGLPNRRLFVEHLTRAIANARRMETSLAVLFFDLDRFKSVNDSLGHLVGDRLLTAVAERLRASLREADLAARLSGDEFAVLAENTTTDGAARLAQHLAAVFRQPFLVDGHELVVTPSIGVAVDGGGVATSDALLRNADLAMYRAKLDGFGLYLMYEPGMHDVASQRISLEAGLRRAVAQSEFEVHYQPIVWLPSGDLLGVEALIRWPQADGSSILPGDFIPVAEDMGLVVPIGRLVLNESMEQMRRWQQERPGAPLLTLSVNLSPRQLYQPELVNEVVEALRTTGFDAERLTFEITETALLNDTAAVTARLHELRALGIRIALDDFGTGYSSLSYLRRLPIDAIKIDRSFIRDMTRRSQDIAVTRTIIELGRTLHLDVVAEGIEDQRQVNELLRMRCRMGQGYHYYKPMAAAAMAEVLRTPPVMYSLDDAMRARRERGHSLAG